MLKNIFGLMLLALLFVSFSSGCGKSGGGGSDPTNDPTSNSTNTTVSNTTTSGTLKVKVENWYNAKVPNATVVLGDSNGVMIAYKTTDSNGEATFDNPPANATVTAANSCVFSGSTNTNYGLDIDYDINATTITMSVNDCSANSTASTVHVKVTDIPAGASNLDIQPNGFFSSVTGSSASRTISIYPDDFQSDGKVSFVVIASESNGHPLSYGVLKDLTVVSGMTITIAANQTLSTVQYQINNIPASAINIKPHLSAMRKKAEESFVLMENIVAAGTSTTCTMHYVPAFGDAFLHFLYLQLDQNGNSTIDSSLQISKWETTAPVDQTFDLSVRPVMPSNLAVTGSGTAMPTLTWSGMDASSYALYLSMEITTAVTPPGSAIYTGSMAAPTRTSIAFPQLPDSLSSFRPTGVNTFSVQRMSSGLCAGYDEYQAIVEQYNNGTWTPPASYTSMASSANYSSTQTLAPKMNRAMNPLAKKVRRF